MYFFCLLFFQSFSLFSFLMCVRTDTSTYFFTCSWILISFLNVNIMESSSTGFKVSASPYYKICCYFVEIKCQLDATEVFIADLIACPTCFGHHYAHHQELKSIIQWLLPVVFRVVVFKLLV